MPPDDESALHHVTRAVEHYRVVGNAGLEALALNAVGWYATRLGRYDEARERCEAALTLSRDQGNRQGEAEMLDSLACIAHHQGRHAEAVTHHEQAIALFREVGDTYELAVTLDCLAHPQIALGHHARARTAWRGGHSTYTGRRAVRPRPNRSGMPSPTCPRPVDDPVAA